MFKITVLVSLKSDHEKNVDLYPINLIAYVIFVCLCIKNIFKTILKLRLHIFILN